MITGIKLKIIPFIFLGVMLFWLSGVAYPEIAEDFSSYAPPQSELVDSKEFIFGGRNFQAVLYKSKENQYDLTNYYRQFFKEQGFNSIFDKKETVAREDKWLLRFKKQDLVVSLALMPKFGYTEVVVTQYLQPAGSLPPEKLRPTIKDTLLALPEKDQPGEDLSIIPRPPKSVRWMSPGTGKAVQLAYNTSLSVDEARDFYKTQMPSWGWEMEIEIATNEAVSAYKKSTGKRDLGIKTPFKDGEDLNQIINDSYVLNFKASHGQARIVIFPNFVDRKLGSIVQILYVRGE